jgi:hypothetical protein
LSLFVAVCESSPGRPPSQPRLEQQRKIGRAIIYGRITATDDAIYEGRLCWGGDQEAFWGDFFDGAKDDNRWAVHSPQPTERRLEVFGFKIGGRDRNFDRPFMARFGDIAHVDAQLAHVRVTLKSGTVVVLDRFAAGDIDDGVRVWDGKRGIVDLDARSIRTIAFLPTVPLAGAPVRLHGTIRTRNGGEFTGFIEWNRQDSVGSDLLEGVTDSGEHRGVRYDRIRSFSRRSTDTVLVTLLDGRELVLSGTRDTGQGPLAIYVDDARYGRVVIAGDAFERVEFSGGGSGPAYGDFAAGRPLAGSVTTRDGRRLTGRLVYDFDESETTDTFDAPAHEVEYNIPFSLITAIVPAGRAGQSGRIVLRSGDQLELESKGDLGPRNAGMLIFVDGRDRPDYVPWNNVEQIDLTSATAPASPLTPRARLTTFAVASAVKKVDATPLPTAGANSKRGCLPNGRGDVRLNSASTPRPMPAPIAP